MWLSKAHLLLLSLLLSVTAVNCFIPLVGFSLNPTDEDGDDNWSHGAITRRAVLDAAADFLRDLPDCNLGSLATVRPSEIFQEISRIFMSCFGRVVSAARFYQAAIQIETANGGVDLSDVTGHLPSAHFDAEKFVDANARLLDLRTGVLTAIEEGEYEAARELTGQLFHTLQDFYSHSNWVEMGNTGPNLNLAVPGADIGPVAGPQMETCVDCSKSFLWYTCEGNIIDSVNEQGLLTSGYYGGQTDMDGNDVPKPENVKCSHGGRLDGTQDTAPKGGINKDSEFSILSPHSRYHYQAAQLAVQASRNFLNMIRQAKGDAQFANFLNLNTGSTLCFVIDTTGSMADDIAASKQRAYEIIDSRVGSPTEPSNYVLVPFNDPDFGPALVTNEADMFKQEIDQLRALGGGDNPEFSLSAIRLALVESLPASTVFVFTDAPAKDAELRDTVVSLANQKNIKITFLISGSITRRRRSVPRSKREVGNRDTYIYIAQATGGQVLEIAKDEVFQTTRLVDLVVTSAEVNLLTMQSVQPSVRAHTVPVDSSMSDLVVQVTAVGATLQVFNPAGEQLEIGGPDAPVTIEIQLNKVLVVRIRDVTAGEWRISVTSSVTYDLRVSAQSTVDFAYSFVKMVTDTDHFGVKEIEGRPVAGEEATIRVNLIGSDPAQVSDVTALSLVALDGRVLQTLPLQENEPLTEYFATSSSLPDVPFRCRLEGKDSGSSTFQRLITSVVETSTSRLQGSVDPVISRLLPGGTVDVPFSLSNSGQQGSFTIVASDDKGFVRRVTPSSVTLARDATTTVTVRLRAPADVAFGTTTTVTLTAQTSSGRSYNFLVFRITVSPPDQDNVPPTCEVRALFGNCKGTDRASCSDRTFSVTTAYMDEGYGLQSINPRTFATNYTWTVEQFAPGLSDTTIIANYTATCCNPKVEFAVSDRVGNYEICTVDLTPPQGLSGGAIAGIVIGVLLAVIIIVFIIVYCCCIRRRQKDDQTDSQVTKRSDKTDKGKKKKTDSQVAVRDGDQNGRRFWYRFARKQEVTTSGSGNVVMKKTETHETRVEVTKTVVSETRQVKVKVKGHKKV
ncbi:von Willebrand factor A domain-containing protein 7-like [Branchiostoma floridae]|uniref:von Willebrand factor A domain-containing protein 7-like n=1 Tax=Branchiostoma floridae TaxID=7739 RepID=A0A9J7N2K9_BRAFL|nr:von Willebrand factor A domain-containing protein 7-like [Branchiostoma floridae]